MVLSQFAPMKWAPGHRMQWSMSCLQKLGQLIFMSTFILYSYLDAVFTLRPMRLTGIVVPCVLRKSVPVFYHRSFWDRTFKLHLIVHRCMANFVCKHSWPLHNSQGHTVVLSNVTALAIESLHLAIKVLHKRSTIEWPRSLLKIKAIALYLTYLLRSKVKCTMVVLV